MNAQKEIPDGRGKGSLLIQTAESESRRLAQSQPPGTRSFGALRFPDGDNHVYLSDLREAVSQSREMGGVV